MKKKEKIELNTESGSPKPTQEPNLKTVTVLSRRNKVDDKPPSTTTNTPSESKNENSQKVSSAEQIFSNLVSQIEKIVKKSSREYHAFHEKKLSQKILKHRMQVENYKDLSVINLKSQKDNLTKKFSKKIEELQTALTLKESQLAISEKSNMEKSRPEDLKKIIKLGSDLVTVKEKLEEREKDVQNLLMQGNKVWELQNHNKFLLEEKKTFDSEKDVLQKKIIALEKQIVEIKREKESEIKNLIKNHKNSMDKKVKEAKKMQFDYKAYEGVKKEFPLYKLQIKNLTKELDIVRREFKLAEKKWKIKEDEMSKKIKELEKENTGLLKKLRKRDYDVKHYAEMYEKEKDNAKNEEAKGRRKAKLLRRELEREKDKNFKLNFEFEKLKKDEKDEVRKIENRLKHSFKRYESLKENYQKEIEKNVKLEIDFENFKKGAVMVENWKGGDENSMYKDMLIQCQSMDIVALLDRNMYNANQLGDQFMVSKKLRYVLEKMAQIFESKIGNDEKVTKARGVLDGM